MFAKLLMIIIGICTTNGNYGAADDTQQRFILPPDPLIPSFIGLASKAEGSCILHTPRSIKKNKNFTITVVYTKMPSLANSDSLAKIAALFARANKSQNFNKETFNETLKDLIKEYAIPSTHLGHIYYKLELDAIILCIKLSKAGVRTFASYPLYTSAPELCYSVTKDFAPSMREPSGEKLKYIAWEGAGSIKFEYNKTLTYTPLEYAQRMQHESLSDEFSLVVDLIKFRELQERSAHTQGP